MKLEDALKQATTRPIVALTEELGVKFSEDGRYETVIELTSAEHDQTAGYACNKLHAALFVHAYNMLPALVNALGSMTEIALDEYPKSDERYMQAVTASALLDRAMEVPGI